MAREVSHDEVNRYERVLADWKPGPGAPKKKPTRTSKPSAKPPAAAYTEANGAVRAYNLGAILLFDDDTLVVYQHPVPRKEYDLVLALYPNGGVKSQGVALARYDGVEEIGALPVALLERVKSEMRWDRDLIVFHCYRYEDVARVPRQPGAPKPAAPDAASAPSSKEESPEGDGAFKRGQRIEVQLGDHMWKAVYWGEDPLGTVVAHRTHDRWELMHLDLARFGDGLVAEPRPDPELIKEIEQQVG